MPGPVFCGGVQYRTIMDHTNDSEYWINPDGKLIYQSPSIEKITGYPREQFYECGQDFFYRIIHPDDRETFCGGLETIEYKKRWHWSGR